MLRITTEHEAHDIRLKLDGKLAGPWVEELASSWQAATLSAGERKAVLVDLSGVTFVDSEGKRLLSKMCAEGAKFRTSCCMTRGIVERIRRICSGTAAEAVSTDSPGSAGEHRAGTSKG